MFPRLFKHTYFLKHTFFFNFTLKKVAKVENVYAINRLLDISSCWITQSIHSWGLINVGYKPISELNIQLGLFVKVTTNFFTMRDGKL